MKVCTKCGKKLPSTGFYRDRTTRDGYHPRCKKCDLDYERERNARLRKSDPEAFLKREREKSRLRRSKDIESFRRWKRNRYWSDPELAREKGRERHAQELERRREISRENYRRYPEKYAARQKLNRAVRRGEIERGSCELESPTCDGAIEAHHDDYSEPFKVRWLCRRHHGEVHRIGASG